MTCIRTATSAGSASRPNEDHLCVSPTAMVLLDGAGGPAEMDNGCDHGTSWYVHRLGAELHHRMATRPDTPLAALLGEAITAVAHAHPECDLSHPGTPSSTVIALRHTAHTGWEYLVLSDSTLLLRHRTGDVTALSDKRIDTVAETEKALMEEHPLGSPEHQRARVAKVTKERKWRNTDGGHWVAAADPAVAAQALTGTTGDLGRAVLMSDGAERWMTFTGRTHDKMLTALDAEGPAEIIAQVRDMEAEDPTGKRLPRAKATDDATIIDVHLPEGVR
jgi:hypothetical protein